MRPEFARAVDVFLWADRGQLPRAGGILGQSAWFVAAFPIVKAEIERARARWAKDAQDEADRKAQRG